MPVFLKKTIAATVSLLACTCNRNGINYRKVIILFFMQAFFLLSFAQTAVPKFTHLTTSDGLSQSTVFAILKDYKGFMWFATDEGLNKYDGYKFTVYKHDPENPASISNNSVYSLLEDGDIIYGWHRLVDWISLTE